MSSNIPMSKTETKADVALEFTTPKDVFAGDYPWPTKYTFRSQWTHRVYFENAHGQSTSLQMSLLTDIMEAALGDEGKDYELYDSPLDMAELWNRSERDEVAQRYGNSIILTQHGWNTVRALINNDQSTDHKHVWAKVSVIEARS